jgi:hypothetical protein
MLHVGRNILRIVTFIHVTFLVACGNQYSTSSIPVASGKFSTTTNAYPGVVMVLVPGGGLCTGAIVSEHAVLTARHCVDRIGVYTVRSKRGDFQTTQVARMGNGSVDDPNDISLLVFDESLTGFNDEIYPIADSASVGDAVTVVGFGCNSVETRSGAGVKRMGTNKVASKTDYLVLLTPKTSTSRAIIGDANQAGTCFGDSGGPLFVSRNGKLEIAGVTHAGGSYSAYYVSEFVNVADNTDNRHFLASAESQYNLDLDM